MYPWRVEHALRGIHEASDFFKLMVKTRCHLGVTQLVKHLRKVTNAPSRCMCFPALQLVCVRHAQLSWGQAGSWRACPQTRQSNKHGLQMLLYEAYAQQITSDKYRKCGDVAPPSPCLFFLLPVTPFSLNAFTLSVSIDRPVCQLQVIIIVQVFKSSHSLISITQKSLTCQNLIRKLPHSSPQWTAI